MLLVSPRCSRCAQTFTADAKTAPQINGQPICGACWRRLNLLREAMGLEPWGTPEGAFPSLLT